MRSNFRLSEKQCPFDIFARYAPLDRVNFDYGQISRKQNNSVSLVPSSS